jgi:HSP20 family protein
MSTRRWDPLRDLLSLQEKMNRLFEDSLAATRTDPGVPASAWTPAADAYETPEGFVVLMDLPGLSADDVEIHVDGERLIVTASGAPTTRRGRRASIASSAATASSPASSSSPTRWTRTR